MQESPVSAGWREDGIPKDTETTLFQKCLSLGNTFWALSFLLLCAVVWLYVPTIQWLLFHWEADEYYGHGPLLPFISAYLIWQNRFSLSRAWDARSEKALFPSGLIFFALFMHWCGSLVEMNSIRALQAFSIPVLILGVARYFGGRDFQKELNFPLLFLFLAVPISGPLVERLTIPMQSYAAGASGMLLGLMGMPIEREGVNLYTPLYHFVVAVPCSGLKIAITLLTMGTLIAHLMPNLSRLQRLVLSLLSIPVALLANTLRVMTIVSLGYHFGPKVAEGFLHSGSGLFMFGISLVLLIGTGVYMGNLRDQEAQDKVLTEKIEATPLKVSVPSPAKPPVNPAADVPVPQPVLQAVTRTVEATATTPSPLKKAAEPTYNIVKRSQLAEEAARKGADSA